MKVQLKKPLVWGDKTIEAINLDGLEDLTGADLDFCVREAVASKGEPVLVLAIDLELHIHMAAKVCGLPVEALKKIGAREYAEVARTVQAFLNGAG